MAQQPVPPTRKTATCADIEALPEHQIGEILDGELIVSPRPSSRHALASHRDDEVVRAEPFDAVEIDLLSLWGETRTSEGPQARTSSKAK